MGFGIPLTGVDIVKLLEEMAAGTRLSHTKLDDIVETSHHAKAVTNFTELAGGEDQTPSADDTWTDWDISAIVPAGVLRVLIGVYNVTGYMVTAGCRKNGSALVRRFPCGAGAANKGSTTAILTEVDANRVIEIYASVQYASEKFSVLGYWT